MFTDIGLHVLIIDPYYFKLPTWSDGADETLKTLADNIDYQMKLTFDWANIDPLVVFKAWERMYPRAYGNGL